MSSRLLVFMILLLFMGCSDQASHERAAGDFAVDVIDESGLAGLINDRRQQILFLNVWATWCMPCVEEFPDLVNLARDYSLKPVEFIGLSVDYADEVDSKIKPFLRRHQVNFRIVVQNFRSADSMINTLNPRWSGAVPATFVFDRTGAQKAFLLGKQLYGDLKKVLDEALADPVSDQ